MGNTEVELMKFYLANAENEKKKMENQLAGIEETIKHLKSIIEKLK